MEFESSVQMMIHKKATIVHKDLGIYGEMFANTDAWKYLGAKSNISQRTYKN